uniref:Histone H3.2 n=1 Tax=Solanum tuberosum TaxID=4113 RepID=M1A775_SOLTU
MAINFIAVVEKDNQVSLDNVGDEDNVTNIEESDKEEVINTQQQITVQSKKPLIKKTVHVTPMKKQNNCNAITTLTESGTELKNQLQKQNHKGFKKMESDKENKREGGAQQTPTQCRRKECTTSSTKSMNVQVAPPPHPKQSNRSSSTRPMQKTSQSSAVAGPIQRETQSDSDMKKKFESSKRKFEERDWYLQRAQQGRPQQPLVEQPQHCSETSDLF